MTLRDRTILVTRPADEGASLAATLRDAGAMVIEGPAIEIEQPSDWSELDDAIKQLAAGEFEWVSFTSPRAADAVCERLRRFGLPPRLPAKVAVVGPTTAKKLRESGVEVDLLADPHTTESLAEQFPSGDGRVLMPRADIAPEGLEAALEGKGWTAVRVEAYRTRFPNELPAEAREALENGRVDAVTFTSPSTVQGLMRLASLPEDVDVVCIGPVTAEAAGRAGLSVAAVATPHTVDGIVRALENLYS